MIKSLLSTALLLMLTLCASAQKPFTIKGSQAKDVATTKYLIYLADEDLNYPKSANDSIIVRKGKIEYSTTINQPLQAIIQKTDANGNPTQTFVQTFFIPGATMTLQATPEQLKIGGALFYQQSQQLKDTMKPASEAIQTAYDHYRSISMDKTIQNRDSALENAARAVTEKQNAFMHTIQDYYAAHKSDEGCVVSLVQTLRDEKYYEGADPSVKNGQFKTYLEKYVSQQQKARAERKAREKAAQEAASKTACGQMFTDFEAEYDGKIQKLSDYVGRGKYVLVDFWASWCGPCRAEIPNLIKVYNQYKGDRFEVLGVATWDKPEDTLKAIGQMGIPYPQIINAQQAGSKAYGITGIPQIILFGPDGTILKRDLRGEDVNAAVEDVLKQ